MSAEEMYILTQLLPLRRKDDEEETLFINFFL
jgi:hypothetical protein